MMKDVGELPEDAIWSEFDFFVLFLYLFIHYYICIVQVYIMMKDVGELPEDAIWSEFDFLYYFCIYLYIAIFVLYRCIS
jgi:hypothetical protein